MHDGSGCEMPAEDHGPAPAGARGAAAEKACSAIAEMAGRSMTLACAESLTGGALCSAFVEIPGASAVLRGSVTAYAVDLKASILGVDGELLRTKGPVEERVALDMARGVCRIMGADVALVNRDFADRIAEVAASTSAEQSIRRMDAISQARTRLAGNVAPLLALEAMMVGLRPQG